MSLIMTEKGWKTLQPSVIQPPAQEKYLDPWDVKYDRTKDPKFGAQPAAKASDGRYRGPLPTKAAEKYSLAIHQYLLPADHVNHIGYEQMLADMSVKVVSER